MTKNGIFIILGLYLIVGIVVAFSMDGTGDAGDSVLHYLYARYAPRHPELFFHHWAKPLFVLLAAPFAQFGFVGIKLFNVLVSAVTMYLCYRAAGQLGYKPAVGAAIITALMPLSFALTFSGLTEPLFALMVAAGLFWALSGRYAIAALTISFLPFVRSEGLLFLGVYGVYFLWVRQWRYLPILLVGHVAYSIAGFWVYQDLFWVFTKIPYNNLGSVYGHGTLFHFVDQLFYAAGLPVFLFICAGILRIVRDLMRRESNAGETILTLGGFAVFFAFHSLAWYWGMFNSMGMKRVLVGIGPLSALLAIKGLQTLASYAKRPALAQTICMAVVLVFPMIGSPSSLHWRADMGLNKDQETIRRVVDFIQSSGYTGRRMVGVHPYVSLALGLDHFDASRRIPIDTNTVRNLKAGDIIVWENWFTPLEFGVTQPMVESTPDIKMVFETTGIDQGREIRYIVYEKMPKQ